MDDAKEFTDIHVSVLNSNNESWTGLIIKVAVISKFYKEDFFFFKKASFKSGLNLKVVMLYLFLLNDLQRRRFSEFENEIKIKEIMTFFIFYLSADLGKLEQVREKKCH